MIGRSWITAGAAAAIALAAAGCGSATENPPAAEPGVAPPQRGELPGRVIELGRGEAEGVAADPRTGVAAVATRDPDRLYLVSDPLGPGGPRVREVAIPESPRHMQLAAEGGPVIFGAERSDELVEVALPSGELTTTVVGDFPHDATAAGGRIFVADEGADTITAVEEGRVVETVAADEQPGGIAAADGLITVVTVAERTLSTYDAETLERVGVVDAGVGPTHVVADDDGRLYVADTQGDAILVFESEPELRLVDRVNLAGKPYGLALDRRRDRLWVTQTERNRVIEYELGELAPRRLRSFATVRQPNTVAVDEATGLIYVAGRSEGVLQIFDPAEEDG